MSAPQAGDLSPHPPATLTLDAIIRLIRLPNQSGTWLLLLPTLWSLVLAERGTPPWPLVAIFTAGSFLMRSAGVAMNDVTDRAYDRQVGRTKQRPVASGQVTPRQALGVAASLITLAGCLVLFLNPVAIALSPIAVALAAVYPFAKRFLHVPQAVLGVAFGWGVVMAWAAARGGIEPPALCLFGGTVLWAVGYDTIYALQDREDDRLVGVKSAALFFGRWVWLAVGLALAGMLGLLALAGWLVGIGAGFYVVLVGVAGFFGWQVMRLRQPLDQPTAFALFKQHVWAGTAILAGCWLGF